MIYIYMSWNLNSEWISVYLAFKLSDSRELRILTSEKHPQTKFQPLEKVWIRTFR